jgi:hypothetical protein
MKQRAARARLILPSVVMASCAVALTTLTRGEAADDRSPIFGVRVQSYITQHNRMFPTKYAKFGNSPLVSLDEVMFEDGTTTRGDTVSRGLWD